MQWSKSLDYIPRFIVAIFFATCLTVGLAIILALLIGTAEAPLLALQRIPEDSALVGALLNTFYLFIASMIFQLSIAFFGTFWIHRIHLWVMVLLVLPYAAGVVAPAFSMYVLFSPALGPLNVGVLSNKLGATLVIAFLDSWQWTGILLLVCFFKLKQVDDSHFEQARLEGVPRLRSWWWIVWPAIKGVVGLFLLVRAIDWFRKVDTVKVLFGQGGPGYFAETIGMYISRNYFFSDGKPYAIFLVLLQMILMGCMVAVISRKCLKRWLGDGE